MPARREPPPLGFGARDELFRRWFKRAGVALVLEYRAKRNEFGAVPGITFDLNTLAGRRRVDRTLMRETASAMLRMGVLEGWVDPNRGLARVTSWFGDQLERHPGLNPRTGDRWRRIARLRVDGERIEARITREVEAVVGVTVASRIVEVETVPDEHHDPEPMDGIDLARFRLSTWSIDTWRRWTRWGDLAPASAQGADR